MKQDINESILAKHKNNRVNLKEKIKLKKTKERAFKRFALVSPKGQKLDFMVHIGDKKSGKKGMLTLARADNS